MGIDHKALRREILSPSGVEYATSAKLIPNSVFRRQSSPSDGSNGLPRSIGNLVIARTNFLRVYEVQEDNLPMQAVMNGTQNRRDTEAVEGEVEMDAQGEGFVNIGAIKSSSASGSSPSTTLRLYLVREHQLHGIVTGLEAVKVLSSNEDHLDRLLVSFKDAKVALLEWSVQIHDLVTVSIHTYERAPQMAWLDPSTFKSELRVDPSSRCATLLLPKDSLAILPFYQSQADLDLMDVDQSISRDIPYSPSFVLDLCSDVDFRIRNVVDYVFLPGFTSPTLAILYQTQQTWTGRLKEYKDTCCLSIFTLDLVTRNYPMITVVENLPHDCSSIEPCPPSLGGVVIVSCNALIYVDQASRKTALPVNGWASRISDMPMQTLRPEEQEWDLHLEGARAVFVDEHTFFTITKDGVVYPVELILDGKIVTRLSMGVPMAQTTIPSLAKNLSSTLRVGEGEVLFIGSTVGPSVLIKTRRTEEEVLKSEVKEEEVPSAVVDPPHAIEIDEDDDIYGDIIKEKQALLAQSNGVTSIPETRSVLHLSLCDTLQAHGCINDIAFALTRNGDRPIAELVAATGSGHLGGFTLFQRDLPTRTKRKIHAVGGARGVWSLPIRQTLKTNGASERLHKPAHSENFDSVIVSTDANPSPGLTRFASRTTRHDINITTRRTETTIAAAPFFQRTAILHVTADLIRVLEPDCSERQCIKDMDGVAKRPKIRYCSVSDPFVLIVREDGSLGLFVGDAERGRIRRKDMTPMGEKISRYSAGCFYLDQSGIFELQANAKAQVNGAASEKGKNVTSSLEAAVDARRGSQWLILGRPQGVIEIWTLPKLTIVFSTSIVKELPSSISDSFDPPAISLPEDPPRKPHELDVDQILMAPIGEGLPQPHLVVLLRSGQMVVYQAVACDNVEWPEDTTRSATLKLRLARVVSHPFDPRQNEAMEKSLISEQRRGIRQLIPFQTSPSPDVTLHGIFFTGDQPSWIVGTAKGGVKIHSCNFAVVNSFTPCSLWDSKGDFLMYTDEGPCLLEWMPNVNLDTNMPSRPAPMPRTYTNVVFDASTSLMVATSIVLNHFSLFDEENKEIWAPDAPNVNYPQSETSTLEIFSTDFSSAMDGFEFLPNEFVNSLDCIPLETQSTESGTKDFIVVGTTVNRGEDLAVRGATYVFETVEVVPDLEKGQTRYFKLRLLCRDEAKGPVTSVCGLNNYLVSSMGQKIFVRALDLDERLVGVAFLDVGVYVTSLRTIKNFLLIGDIIKSVWFVAFQEDPFKLVVLAKDVQSQGVTSVDFLFDNSGEFYIVTHDEEGVVRLFEYDPSDPESRNGQYLLRRTEFHGQVECRVTALVARRLQGEEGLVPQARLISGASDGSMYSLTPVEDEAMKRLQLLQGSLSRNMQHVAGLNPKAFRIVRNDSVSRPLAKGILDGNLISAFETLPIPRQVEITQPIGIERSSVLKDWVTLSGPW